MVFWSEIVSQNKQKNLQALEFLEFQWGNIGLRNVGIEL